MGWELVDSLQKASAAISQPKRFVFIDGVLDSKNLIYANFAEEQGSFMAGALASMIEPTWAASSTRSAAASPSASSAAATFR